MPSEPSRAVKSGAAAGALTLALSGTALAMPAGPDSGAQSASPSGNVTAGTDVAAPDQQNPIPVQPKPVPQQAPTWPVNPQVLHRPVAASTPSAGDDFKWTTRHRRGRRARRRSPGSAA